MTRTFPVYILLGTKYYLIESTQVKRTLKNKIIKVQKPLSKAKQDGVNEPETLLIDLKKIEDLIMIIGHLPAQDTSATRVGTDTTINPTFTENTQKNAVDVFEDMVTDFKKIEGPYHLFYKGKKYSVLIDQLEHTDRSNMLQTSKVNNTTIANIPQRVDVSISFTIGTVR